MFGEGSAHESKGSEEAGDNEGKSEGPAEMSQTELIQAAQAAYDEAQEALADGNWAEYGKHMDEVEQYLNKLVK